MTSEASSSQDSDLFFARTLPVSVEDSIPPVRSVVLHGGANESRESAVSQSVSTPRFARGKLFHQDGQSGFALTVTRQDSYRIVVERGALGRLSEYLCPLLESLESRHVVVISDNQVSPLYGAALRDKLAPFAAVDEIVVPSGELSKSTEMADYCWHELLRKGVKRRALLVALGGGVICDLVGFVAASYMRGLPYVNIATSLMAQVDGAVGGKVGVDLAEGKNLVGAFHHPSLVVIDPDTLSTLPRRHIVNALAEVVKVALIASPGLFRDLERLTLPPEVPADGPLGVELLASLDPMIHEAVRIKLDHLAADPFEQDLRRLLNLGHAVGHTLEALTGYGRYLHGEAVSIGMATVTAIAAQSGLCTWSTAERIVTLLEKLSLPRSVPAELVRPSWERLETIRLIRNGKLLLVLPVEIGGCTIVDDITFDQYRSACAFLERV